jgi:predicted lysophospholipase L1 biosynthesis ABC-type transport system permease subunit
MRTTGDTTWATVVGVVADSKELSLAEPPGERIFGSLWQSPGIFVAVAVRTAGDPARASDELRRAVWSVDRDQPVWRIRPLADYVDLSTRQQRFTAAITIAFAVVALLLGAIGVYGVMSHAVAQRTREMALRMALGATGGRVISMVVGGMVKLSVAGTVAGVLIAAGGARALTTQLFGVTPHDPLTFVTVPLVLLSVAALAAYAPARRASRVDATVALRSD